MTQPTGPKPELRWIDKRLLTIEPIYQRAVSSRRGQALIEKIAAGWYWTHASVLIVAQKGDLWTIIDGQHRHQAAMRRKDINDLPCLIVEAKLVTDQARAFLAHNRDRVTLNFLSLFHGEHAAGDPIAHLVIEACAEAGVNCRRSVTKVQSLLPEETMATGTMSQIVKYEGKPRLVEVLRIVREAYPNTPGQLRGNTIKAVAALTRHGVDRNKIIAALKITDGMQLEDQAREIRRAQTCSIPEGFIIALGRNCGVEIDARAAISMMTRPVPKEKKPKVPKPPPKPKLTALAAPKRSATFQFARKPQQPPPAKSNVVDLRGNVPVRRFESGTADNLIERALAELGLQLVNNPKKAKKPYSIGTRMFTRVELISFVDDIRKKKRLPPIGTVAK